MTAREHDRAARGATVATVLLIAAVWLACLPLLSVGGISHFDEFYTLDRAISFGRMGDWFTVFSGNEPSFRKPPLQYWMSAGLLDAGVGETVALRLPSMLFALGTLAATAWLARAIAPALPWAMPISVGLLASSVQFWSFANSGMLDVGAGFFAAAAVAAAVVALDRPRVWYVVALLLGLGALQKAPAGVASWAWGFLRSGSRADGSARPVCAMTAASAGRRGWRWRSSLPGRCCRPCATGTDRSANRTTGRCSRASPRTRTKG
jgi:4-amino-4-deoxy-L-arabinose transferase-like glycosyltransferase